MSKSEDSPASCKLVTFKDAELKPTAMPIEPPIFALIVSGEVNSLGVDVSIVFKGIEIFGPDAWADYELVGCGAWDAIGSRPYHARRDISLLQGTKGIRVLGANGEVNELPWPKG